MLVFEHYPVFRKLAWKEKMALQTLLVGGFNPFEKILVKMEIFPK